MDIQITIVAVIITAAFFFPFVYMSRNRRKKEKQMLSSLTEISARQNGNISRFEICRDFIIGLDEHRNFLYFFRQLEEQEFSQAIDLNLIEKCKAIVTRHSESNHTKIDKLELCFTSVSKSQKPVLLPFYDSEINIDLQDEFQVIQKWEKIVNEKLKPASTGIPA